MAGEVEVVETSTEQDTDNLKLTGAKNQDADEGFSGRSSPGAGSDDPGSEAATGHGSLAEGEENLEDLSDTGWDTDLELEEEKVEYDTTGKRVYLETCETLGVIPASCFLRSIEAGEHHINLCHHGVGPKGTKAIAVALTNNTAVTHLDLSDNGLATEGAIAITTMMKENCYITHLDLSDNNMGPPAAFALAPLVSINSTLVHLSLRGNGFNDKASVPVAEIIRTSFHIKFLDLSHNEFGEEGGVVLGPALTDCEVLQTLDLSWNHIRRKGAAAIADGMKNNQSLRSVNLSYNGIDNQGAVALADALKINSTLEQLDISNNRICTDGAIVLSKILPINDTLKELKIGHNPLQSPGIIAFLDALKVCTTCSLQILGLDGITITLAIDKSLKEVLDTHTQLSIPHGGTGGYKHPKPKQEPIEKLDNYCKENSVVLIDLFKSFDKEGKKYLPEEQFRAALKHISAPLMEFERQKLIAGFVTSPPPPEPTEDGAGEETTPAQDGEPTVFVDYILLVETAKQLKSMKTIQT